jgi:hypothetical protein
LVRMADSLPPVVGTAHPTGFGQAGSLPYGGAL